MINNVSVNWYIQSPEPSVTLIDPVDTRIFMVDTAYFNWTSSGGDGTPLQHVWYLDTLNTFTSPLRVTEDTGLLKTYKPTGVSDGCYYWRVEVTDNTTVVASSTRQVIFNTNPGNDFPYLTNKSLLPVSGDTNTNFVYQIQYFDANNDSANYVKIHIDGVAYAMTESNSSDVTTTDGKYYSTTTTLTSGLHNYSFSCSDGNAINATTIYSGPTTSQADDGGGGGISTGEKMNKVTITPMNEDVFPGGAFVGSLTITEEGTYPSTYEVFWYMYLLDSNESVVSQTEGAVAIDTTVSAVYRLRALSFSPPGEYSLLAKTYDRPIELVTAKQLGQDRTYVNILINESGTYDIVGGSPIENILNDFTDEESVQNVTDIILVLFVIAILIFTIIWLVLKKDISVMIATVLTMSFFILYGVISFNEFKFLSIVIVVAGEFLLSKYSIMFIKRRRISKILGFVLVGIGILFFILL